MKQGTKLAEDILKLCRDSDLGYEECICALVAGLRHMVDLCNPGDGEKFYGMFAQFRAHQLMEEGGVSDA
jgi:hypothetical protein